MADGANPNTAVQPVVVVSRFYSYWSFLCFDGAKLYVLSQKAMGSQGL
jgi:hypothetical protein